MNNHIVHLPRPTSWPPDESAVSLDADGTILAVSSSWVAAALRAGASAAQCGLGRNYLDFCTGDEAAEIRHRLADLIAGRIDRFATIYDCGTAGRSVPVAVLAIRQTGPGPTRFILRHVSLRTGLYADDGSLKEPLAAASPAQPGPLPALLAAVDDLRLALDALSRDGAASEADADAARALAALLRGTVLLIDEVAPSSVLGREAF